MLKISPTLTYHLKENLGKVSDKSSVFNKMVKFRKIDGKPASYGAHTYNKCLLRMALTLAKPNYIQEHNHLIFKMIVLGTLPKPNLIQEHKHLIFLR